MKKIISLILPVVIVLNILSAVTFILYAADVKYYGDYEYEVSDGKVVITRYTGEDANVTVPSEIDGYPVKELGPYSFAGSYSMETVILPEGLETIDDSAFSDCMYLKSITLPSSVTSIGDSAFFYCDSLKEIVLPAKMTELKRDLFTGCHALEKIVLPRDLVMIGDSAFGDCFSLTEVRFTGSSLTEIGPNGFNGCTSLTEITLPDGLKIIGEDAFSYCSMLTDIKIPDSVVSIGEDAFYYCMSLEKITLPAGLESIGDRAFRSTHITEITLPAKLREIGSMAFSYCGMLEHVYVDEANAVFESLNGIVFNKNNKELVLFPPAKEMRICRVPDGTASIGEYAFYNCDSIKEIILPESIETIGYYAFMACDSLEAITVLPENKSFISIDGVLYNKERTELIAYPAAKASAVLRVPDGVESINDGAFYAGNKLPKNLAMIILPDTLTEIGNVERGYYGNFNVHILYAGTEEQAKDISYVKWNPFAGFTWHYSCAGITDDMLDPYEVVNATCTEEGYSLYRCPVCDETFDILHTAPHHTYIKTEAKRPTHEQDGNFEYYTCTQCGKMFWLPVVPGATYPESTEIEDISETVDPASKYHSSKEALLYDERSHWGICYYCGEVFDKEEHVYAAPEIIKAATETRPGLRIRKCLYCGHQMREVIHPLGGMLGDINSDKVIDGIDSGLLLQIIAGWDVGGGLNLDMADIDGDGSITGTDSGLMLQYLAGWFDEFPV